ncbi:23S rRNA pseudouridine2605 synthase [Rhizobiales bacterium GAS113]|jgi:23S rRNA pseudouridine2605 synthase|nr:23S rRNA pseudouridine2605 synthase [Rhizobiales bacterium GAS113]SED53720.1 23S rRNA pseudouridine2605 synthase [Rhizobiales bacterium GAS188]
MAHDNQENGGDRRRPQRVPRRKGATGGRDVSAAEPAAEEAKAEDTEGERISKVVSRAGIASRRDVERMIEEGRIALNGETVTTPVTLVTPFDRISVDGVPLPAKERTRLFLYHKPVGLVTTEKDPEGRPTVFDELPAGLPRVVSIGRLDLNTEGLLLLTNDGGLARVLAHPTTGWLRRYRVRAFGEVTQDQLDGLRDGIEIDGMQYGPVEAHVDREQGANMWLTLGLREGKNREVKRILEHFGLQVNRLIRISFGPFQLGELEVGGVEEIRTRTLKDQLGPELAREAHVDFVDEVQEPRLEPRERGRRPAPGGFERAPKDGGSDEARALRKAQAVAQGQRKAAHRHSWRDAESWAVRGQKKPGPAAAKRSRDIAGAGKAPRTDERTHLRGGRIADRKGRSVLVERIAQDPAAAAPRAAAKRGERPSPPRDTDVLRRKTRREQGLEAAPGGEAVASRHPGQTRSEAWKEHGGQRPFPRPDRRPGDERPPRREGADRPPRREGDRPWQRREAGDRPPRPEGYKPRGEGFRPRTEGYKPRGERTEGFKPRTDRPGGFKPRGERTEGFKPRSEGFKPRTEGYNPRPERAEGFKPRSDRPGGFKPRSEGFKPRTEGYKPRGERTEGFKPRGERSEGFKPRGERTEGFKPRTERTEGFKPRTERTEGFRPRTERTEGFKPRGERSEGFKPRSDRPGGFKPRTEGYKPRSERPEGFKPRSEGFKPRGERSEGFKPRGDRPGGFKPRSFGARPGGPAASRGGPPKGRPGRPPGRPPRKPPA